ncbi:MAG TPA: GNAT family protein [Thermoplasmata archaeon]|nr:GNAT family protein [Thermoplasmata archaeon]
MGELDGPNVRLRSLTRADAPGLFAWYNDPAIVAPYDRFGVDTYDEFVRSLEAAPADPASLAPRFGVERRAEGDLVGVVGHYRAHPVLESIDIWYVLGRPEARGRGLGKEAVGLLVDRLFRTESVERIGATCDIENVPSVRLLEGLGFRREGTLRLILFHHGRWHDVHVYGVTRAEWTGRRPPAPG